MPSRDTSERLMVSADVRSMRIVLDTNIWSYIGRRGEADTFEELARAKHISVVVPPSVLLEVMKTPDPSALAQTRGDTGHETGLILRPKPDSSPRKSFPRSGDYARVGTHVPRDEQRGAPREVLDEENLAEGRRRSRWCGRASQRGSRDGGGR
jgi:hypothetical protein